MVLPFYRITILGLMAQAVMQELPGSLYKEGCSERASRAPCLGDMPRKL